MPTLACLRCGANISVSDDAPPRITCPRCLFLIENPNASLDLGRPRQVAPLEQQVKADLRLSGAAVLLATLLFAFGVLLLMFANARFARQPWVIRTLSVVALLTVSVSGIVVAMPQNSRRRRVYEPAARDARENSNVLDYRGTSLPYLPRPAVDADRGLAMFVFGIVIGIVLVIGIISISMRSPITLAVVPVAGIVFACIRRLRMFGAGMLCSIAVVFLLIAGACGGFR
jgi:hypothetical protein